MSRDFCLCAAFEEVEHEHLTQLIRQFVERGIDMRLDVRPRCLTIRVPSLRHGFLDTFARALATHGIAGPIPSHTMQPCSDGLRDAACLSRQFQKRLLRHILRRRRIASHPNRRGMNHGPMRLHQLTKRVSIAGGDVALEVLEIGRHRFS